MAGVAGLRNIPVKPVLMALLTVSRTVPAEKRKTCRVMFELRGSPRVLRMALRAFHHAELVHMGVKVALIAVTVYLLVIRLCQMAVRADGIKMNSVEFGPCPLFMVELPRRPIRLRMA